jgi:hypothetical protein
MLNFCAHLRRFLLLLSLFIVLFGCSPVKPTATPSLIWKIELLNYEVKDKLEGIEVVHQYVGSTEVVHQQYPDEGNVYLIMKVTINKQSVDTAPFVWDQLTVQDSSGNTYKRLSNDTFLEQFNYKPRITGLELIVGENEGWMCYEIPAQAANGKLTLIYIGEGSWQESQIKK